MKYNQLGQLSTIPLGYELDDLGFDSRQGLGIFLFTNVSRPALRPTQPPIQWIPGALSLRSSVEVKNAWSYTPCLRGVVLS
jgi:hypothetical protein